MLRYPEQATGPVVDGPHILNPAKTFDISIPLEAMFRVGYYEESQVGICFDR
jgi:hypothetical protein